MTIHWAKYQKPLPEGYPVKHFQQSRYEWKDVRWSGGRMSCREWSPADGLRVRQRNYLSEAGVKAYLNELTVSGFSLARQGTYPSGRTDYSQLRREIKLYAAGAYEHIQTTLQSETLCGFALASDSDAMTLNGRATTLKGIEARDSALTRDIAFFAVAEWPYGDDRRFTPEFMSIMNSKRDWKVPFDRQVSHKEHKARFFEACVAALEEMRREGVFPDQSEHDFLIMFEVMDDEPSGSKTFLRLNPRRLLVGYEQLCH